jgi:hypothetical protein
VTLEERYDALAGAVRYRDLARGGYRWLTDTLVKTDGARQRLRAWALAGCHDGPRELCYTGNESIGRAADAVLQALPPPVAWHVARAVLVIGQGFAGGMCATFPKLPPCDENRQIVTVGKVPNDADLPGIIAHEFAHAWTFGIVAVSSAVALTERLAWYDRIRSLVTEHPQLVTDVIGDDLRHEWLAVTLAREWGFTGPATDFAVARRGPAAFWGEK